MILSQHVEVGIAMRLLAETPEGLGYLLKDRVTAIEDFTSTLRRVAAGGSALDPKVTGLLRATATKVRSAALSAREREVLGADRRGTVEPRGRRPARVTTGAVQKHVRAVSRSSASRRATRRTGASWRC